MPGEIEEIGQFGQFGDMEMREAAPRSLAGGLGWFVVGWSAATLCLPLALDPGPGPGRCTLELEPLPDRPPSTRAWRSVPGVGRQRALALARAFWSAGADFEPEAVPGVGPVTGAAVRRFLGRDP